MHRDIQRMINESIIEKGNYIVLPMKDIRGIIKHEINIIPLI